MKNCNTCGHDQASHLVHQFEDGVGPSASRHCHMDNCSCEKFFPIEMCEECGEELKPSQYALREKPDGSAWKDTDHLVCRNYPNCSKAEKEIESPD